MKALRFNQDATCCVVTQGDTVCIYNCDPFGKCFSLDASGTKGDKGTGTVTAAAAATTESNTDSNSNNGVDSNVTSNAFNTNGSRQAVDSENVVEMLFSTSLVAIATHSGAGNNSSRKLKIVNTKRRSTICELVFPTSIVDVVMNRKRMCVLLQSGQIFIYDISCMKPLETIDIWEDKDKFFDVVGSHAKGVAANSANDNNEDVNQLIRNQLQHHSSNHDVSTATQRNTNHGKSNSRMRSDSIRGKIRPRMALSNDDRSILCFSTYHTSKSNPQQHLLRDVVVYDALYVKPINYLNNVHRGNISCLAINHDGTLITTASDKGTIIRVFNTGTDTLQFYGKLPLYCEFRRGNRPCNLYQLTFSKDSSLIGCVGDSDTIHIFKLDNLQKAKPQVPSGETPSLSSTSGGSAVTMGNPSTNQTRFQPPLTIEEETLLRANEGDAEAVKAMSSSNIEKSKQVAQFISNRLRATIPNQNLKRDFAHINVNDSSVRYCLGFPDEFPSQVYLAGDDGKFNVFALPQVSGRCVLTSTSKFI